MANTPEQTAPNPEELRAAIASGDPVQAMPALAKLRALPDSDNDSVVIPLLILGSEQQAFLVRSLSCSGLGYRRNEQGWQVLSRLLLVDEDPNVRAEAANALASFGVERSWPLLRDTFAKDGAWLVRCSILSAFAEQPGINPAWLLELGKQAIADADGTVRVSGAEILARLVREQVGDANGSEARALLQPLQQDADHRVVAAALNGLQP
ncbi:HEAT repeat domain-containing protein [Synechococcus sp. CC9311]|uniref:HEAT repeat domain-containing protein n=1 Tax=Synechococcus sp. (strain CC9311) TaxID=64471 RepID=UPI0000DDA993|nr:HEAT repeat domain-containing protein [Synechococcus sp. CC9311]ABI46435.1 CotB mutant [Synechococcus sp. CC9311]|mmetsp:Transcript_57238/g.134720  ORF Transcript_57238/g.134720 Transcript_57238/m.134720 type:complete len:209 (-) Transcript_57238:20-646(-)